MFDPSVDFVSKSDIMMNNGRDEGVPILLALKGVVFDVSSEPRFYAKGSEYNRLAGTDCSRATAKMSLEPADQGDSLHGLTAAERSNLDTVFWDTYVEKYPVAALLDDSAA